MRNVCYQLGPCSSGRKTWWENLSYWQPQVHKMSNTSRFFNSLLPKSFLLHQNSTSWFWKVIFSSASQVSFIFPHLLSLCKECETSDLFLLCGRFELVPIYSQRLFRHNQVERSSRNQRREDEELRDKIQQYFFFKDFSLRNEAGSEGSYIKFLPHQATPGMFLISKYKLWGFAKWSLKGES